LRLVLPLLPVLALGCAPETIPLGEERPAKDAAADADTATDTDTDTATDTATDTDTDTDTDTTPPARMPTSCAGALALDPSAASGVYTIDLDGDGRQPAFDVRCDMDTDGGGWTLWWWFDADDTVNWRAVDDVLGEDLSACDPGAASCFAHIPDPAAGEIRVTDGTDWATWAFAADNRTSDRAYGAFVNLEMSSYELDLHLEAWNPVRQSTVRLAANYACDANEDISSDGDCRNFWYEEQEGPYGRIRSFNLDDDGGYGQTAIAGGTDNAGYDVGCDVFERSLAYTNGDCRSAIYYR